MGRILSTIRTFLYGYILSAVTLEAAMAQWTGEGLSEPRIVNFQVLPPNRAQIEITRPKGQTYTLLVSANFLKWTPVALPSPDSSDAATAVYTIDLPPEWSQAFYQVTYQDLVTNPEPIPSLDAPGTDFVTAHLPDMGVPVESEDEVLYLSNTVPVSLTHILVSLAEDTEVQAFNDLLQSEGLSIGGAVPGMKLAILRLPTATTLDDLVTQMNRLRDSGLFSSVAGNLGSDVPRRIEDTNAVASLTQAFDSSLDWTWAPSGLGTGSGGNNAFELSRLPQLWNWLDYGYRQKATHGSHDVAVLEFAFYDHFNLGADVILGFSQNGSYSVRTFNHGVAVMGIIAASHDQQGIQGVTPLANRYVGVPNIVNNTSTNAYASVRLGQLASLLTGPQPPKVINISAGIPYYKLGIPTQTNIYPGITYAEWMDDIGDLWADCFEFFNRTLPNTNYLIVCSAGNDDGVNARYNSPSANIACRPDLTSRVPQFLTVESVDEDRSPSDFSNYDHSGIGHAASAGGSGVTVLKGPAFDGYNLNDSGTSYASPFVAGLASFLWTLAPTLTIAEMKILLLGPDTTMQVAGETRANLVDGFAAALGIDQLRATYDLQRALLDVDDGTADGNLRARVHPYEPDPDAIHTADGRRGDGRVTMKDFRAFRDAWLQAIGMTDYLDGPPSHFKRDANFDGLVGNQTVSPEHPAPYKISDRNQSGSLSETVYSRYDFNGNGKLDTATDQFDPPPDNLAPFKADPDTEVMERDVNNGILRDVDVFLEPSVWANDSENVDLGQGSSTIGSFFDPLPSEWTTNNLAQITPTSTRMPYLWSFDLHLDMEEGINVSEYQFSDELHGAIAADGIRIDSFFRLQKGRRGAWQGVVTIPFMDPTDQFYDISPEGFPWVSLVYKKTQDDEYRVFQINFRPEPGEDIGLVVGFEKFQFFSTSRDVSSALSTYEASFPAMEMIVKSTESTPYGSFFLASEDFNDYEEDFVAPAREIATMALASRLLVADVLGLTPVYEPLFTDETEGDGFRVNVFGLSVTYQP